MAHVQIVLASLDRVVPVEGGRGDGSHLAVWAMEFARLGYRDPCAAAEAVADDVAACLRRAFPGMASIGFSRWEGLVVYSGPPWRPSPAYYRYAALAVRVAHEQRFETAARWAPTGEPTGI